jgi:hypothetical protein
MAWICPIVVTFGSPRLSFSEGYTHRVAISNRRLVAADDDAIAFRWKDYRVNGQRLYPHEFIRRFLIHVLPKGFHRIRHYGLPANGNRSENIAHARELLAAPARPKQTETPEAAFEQPGVLPQPCPCCGGRTIIIETFAQIRAQAPAHAAASGNQDRHVMMTSSAIDARPDARFSCPLSADSAQARITTSGSPARRATPIARFTPTYPTMLCRKPIAATVTIQPQQARNRGIIPIAPAAPPPHTFRDFVPWRFLDAGRHSTWKRSSCRRPKIGVAKPGKSKSTRRAANAGP